MNWRTQCAAVIPCLNEEAGIGALVPAVRAHVNTVIVVDDGSADSTAARAAQAGAEVIRHEACRGKGAALQTGWRRARRLGLPWTLMLDGDGQHSPADIPAFFKCAEATGAALVVGNRMDHAGQMPWLRRQVNRWMSRRLSRAMGRPLPDSQCGFRLMRLDSWVDAPLVAAHFEVESEMLRRFVATGQVVEFIPIRVIYENERSKIRPFRDTLRWFRWWQRATSSRVSSCDPPITLHGSWPVRPRVQETRT